MEFKRKIWTLAFLLFCAAQAFFIFKRIHNYPFVIYDMYSRVQDTNNPTKHFLILIDGDSLNTTGLPIYAEGQVNESLKIYQSMAETGADRWDSALTSRQKRFAGPRLQRRSDRLLRNAAQNAKAYPSWLLQNLEKRTDRHIHELLVYQVTYDGSDRKIIHAKLLIEFSR